MASTIDRVLGEIHRIKQDARKTALPNAAWPMIVLRTPKGWTCPKEIDGRRTEGYWRAHQVPMGEMHENPEHVRILEEWMKSYRPEELFDRNGRLRPELAELPPQRRAQDEREPAYQWRPAAERPADAGLPRLCGRGAGPGAVNAEATREMGRFLRDIMKLNMEARNFRLFSPDENNSNRWQDLLEVTNRAWMAQILAVG